MMQPLSLSVATLVSSNDRTDFNITDFYNIVADSRNVRTLDPDIVLIDIADASRDEIADLIDALPAFEPRAVGLDVAFVEERPGDEFLIDAVNANPEMVMLVDVIPDKALNATTFTPEKASYFTPDHDGRPMGAANLPTKIPGGVVRSFVVEYPAAQGHEPVHSFPVEIARIADPDAFACLKARGHSHENINYPSRTFRTVQFDQIGDKPELLRDRILLVGALHDQSDLHATPPQIRMSGLEIHAHALSTILHREYLEELPEFGNIAIACLLCFLLAYIHLSLPAAAKSLILRIIQVALLYLILRVGYYYFIDRSLIVNFSYTLLMLTFVLFACDIWLGMSALINRFLNRKKQPANANENTQPSQA